MSEHSLPDDLTRWPNDPNELLGVSFGVTPRELRRAYNRLIRIYKPEQYPEHFRRIREAYEHLLRIAEWFSPRVEASDLPPPEEPQLSQEPKEQSSDEAPEWIAGMPQPVEENSDKEAIPTQPRRPKEELDELWEAAIAGRPAVAYERLLQMTQQHAGRTELYQRLYWLLKLWPQLEAGRVPADWLVQGLLATGLAGPLRELYREEVADDPSEVLSERYECLLDWPAPIGLLADLIEWRFNAAVRLERWDVINTDLSRLRSRFGVGEEQLWLRLLFSVAEAAVWAINPAGARVFTACRKEIARLDFVNSHMSACFDRFELLLAAAAGWRKLFRQSGVLAAMNRLLHTPLHESLLQSFRRRIPATILLRLRDLWSRPSEESRKALMCFLEDITTSPQTWLNYLDTMYQRAPSTLAMFGDLLNRIGAIRGEEVRQHDRDGTTEFARIFLSRLNVLKYKKERKRLLLFCVREHISPEEMAEAAKGAWERRLMADWPLRYLCRACRLFWA